MEPLNKKERKKAFWKFLAFFVITIIFLMGAVYINVGLLPGEQNEVLRAKYERLDQEVKFQTDFSEGIKEVKATLDSINQSNQNVMYLEQVINTKLAGIQESVSQTDSLQQDKLYNYIIQALLDLQESKRKLRDLQDTQKLIEKYQENIERYKEELEQTQQNLNLCRQLSQ